MNFEDFFSSITKFLTNNLHIWKSLEKHFFDQNKKQVFEIQYAVFRYIYSLKRFLKLSRNIFKRFLKTIFFLS